LRLVSFVYREYESYGVVMNNEIIDLPKVSRAVRLSIPSSIEALVPLGSDAEVLLKKAVDELSDSQREKVTLQKSDVLLRPPFIAPSKIVCLGLNYRDHAEESGAVVPDEPVIFMKPRTAIIGPEEPIVKPGFVKELDYEVELAIVIGQRGKNIPLSDAESYIFGYTVFNDVSARDIQFKDGQWTRGKSFDTFAPLGPSITTGRQIGDPNNLRMQTRVNGQVRQSSSTRLMIFNVPEIIYHISRVMTLEPCDIIATGTPAGVAAFMKPKPKFLQPGDTVEVEIEEIGVLRNRVQEGA